MGVESYTVEKQGIMKQRLSAALWRDRSFRFPARIPHCPESLHVALMSDLIVAHDYDPCPTVVLGFLDKVHVQMKLQTQLQQQSHYQSQSPHPR